VGGRGLASGRTLVVACGLACGAAVLLLSYGTGLLGAIVEASCGALGVSLTPGSLGIAGFVVGALVVLGLAVIGFLLGASAGMVAVAAGRAVRSPRGLATFPAEMAALMTDLPGAAAALSFLLPGFGQAAAGRFRRGAIVAVPAAALLAALVALFLLDRSAFYQVLDSRVLMSLLILDLAALIYHLWAILDAERLAGRLRPVAAGAGRWIGLGAVGVVVAATLGIHGWLAVLDVRSQQTLSCTMNQEGPCIEDLAPGETIAPDTSPEEVPTEEPTLGPWIAAGSIVLDPTRTAAPAASPTPQAETGPFTGYTTRPPAYTGDPNDWAGDGYLNVLLIGGDAGIGRGGNAPGKRINLRTDTLILLEVDLATGRSAMYGIPRNLYNAPLGEKAWDAYACHCFPKSKGFYFGLWLDAVNNPSKYPYAGNYFARGTKAVEDSVGSLLGLHVDGAVVVDLMGFVNLIDALAPNGLTINVPYEVKQMPGFGYNRPEDSKNIYGIDFKKGVQKMNGHQALEYARMRHVVGYDSDYYRMGRQQLVLKAVRDQLNPCELLPRVSTILTALQGTIWTDMSQDDAPQLAALAAKISTKNIRSIALTPLNGFSSLVSDPGAWQKYKDTVARGLDFVPSAYSSGSGSGGAGFHC
jgi:LCP family protein required for cell wall assembly